MRVWVYVATKTSEAKYINVAKVNASTMLKFFVFLIQIKRDVSFRIVNEDNHTNKQFVPSIQTSIAN